jgi:hypothetical protein
MLLISLAGWHLYTAQQYAAAQRALRLAAEGELARWRAGLQPAPSSAPGLRAVGADQAGDPITLRTTSLPGTGPWQGFTHVRVVAQRLARDHVWQFEFCGYVLSPVSSEGDP